MLQLKECLESWATELGMSKEREIRPGSERSDPSHGFQLRGRLAVGGFELLRASARLCLWLLRSCEDSGAPQMKLICDNQLPPGPGREDSAAELD